jgi:hypothetical protein
VSGFTGQNTIIAMELQRYVAAAVQLHCMHCVLSMAEGQQHGMMAGIVHSALITSL